MSYIYHGNEALIALPNRTVQTYPSGLVRVERSFACRKNVASFRRNSLILGSPMPKEDGTLSPDGLFIFPDPSEVMREDGFVEFRVTAYGRTNTAGQRISQSSIETHANFTAVYEAVNTNYDANNPQTQPTFTSSISVRIDLLRVDAYYHFCVLRNETVPTPSDLFTIGGIFYNGTSLTTQKFKASSIFPQIKAGSTQRGDASALTRERSFNITASPINFQRVNFGRYDEISVTYAFGAQDLSFGSFFDAASVPPRQSYSSFLPTYTGAIIDIQTMPFADGVTITVNGETLKMTYGGGATGSLFRAGFVGGAEGSLVIEGLSPGTVYQWSIAAFNTNGVSATQGGQFKTKSY